MCGRFTQAFVDWTEVASRFRVASRDFDAGPRYNVAPRQVFGAVVTEGGLRRLTGIRWGLIPPGSRGMTIINARAETLLEKPFFRRLARRRRCLIPADSFFEWPAPKQPLRIQLADRPLFAFAGLYDWEQTFAAEPQFTCAIVTCAANAFMQSIHRRMPLILPISAETPWLDPELTDSERILSLLTPTEEELSAYPVHPDIGQVGHDGSEWVVPYKP